VKRKVHDIRKLRLALPLFFLMIFAAARGNAQAADKKVKRGIAKNL
jgi:hypothetical protein